MKDYNFMISDDRLHKARFCKKRRGGEGAAKQNFPYKEGVGAKGGGVLERFCILREWGWPKTGMTFLGGRGVHTLVPTM